MLKLSPGQAGDAPQGRELLEAGGPAPPDCLLIMDSAYEGDETLRLARQLGYTPIVPPNPKRLSPWEMDRVAYRRRNEMERLFRRLKSDRRVFCRFDKLDVLFWGLSSWRSLSKLCGLVLTGPRAIAETAGFVRHSSR